MKCTICSEHNNDFIETFIGNICVKCDNKINNNIKDKSLGKLGPCAIANLGLIKF